MRITRRQLKEMILRYTEEENLLSEGLYQVFTDAGVSWRSVKPLSVRRKIGKLAGLSDSDLSAIGSAAGNNRLEAALQGKDIKDLVSQVLGAAAAGDGRASTKPAEEPAATEEPAAPAVPAPKLDRTAVSSADRSQTVADAETGETVGKFRIATKRGVSGNASLIRIMPNERLEKTIRKELVRWAQEHDPDNAFKYNEVPIGALRIRNLGVAPGERFDEDQFLRATVSTKKDFGIVALPGEGSQIDTSLKKAFWSALKKARIVES